MCRSCTEKSRAGRPERIVGEDAVDTKLVEQRKPARQVAGGGEVQRVRRIPLAVLLGQEGVLTPERPKPVERDDDAFLGQSMRSKDDRRSVRGAILSADCVLIC